MVMEIDTSLEFSRVRNVRVFRSVECRLGLKVHRFPEQLESVTQLRDWHWADLQYD